mgnify:CR=1 FL=1|tara:strand:- start:19070 stop:20056 length:987 start_codon:yes stop_codon:yes gene_type:complete
MNECVLITGAGGQDAYFLSKYLTRNTNYNIIGLTNDQDKKILRNTSLAYFNSVKNISLDDFKNLETFIISLKPRFIFNFGAVAGSLTQFDNPQSLVKINSLSILIMLETIRINNLDTKLIQASSSEIFASNKQYKQSLEAIRRPRTIYGASKIFSDSLIEVYRNQFNIDCFSVVLFSHESPLRKDVFFTKKIVNQIFDFVDNKIDKIKVYAPSAKRDWGYAGDYCKYIAEKALSNNKDDLLIGSGEANTVKDFVKEALSFFNLDYNEVVEEVEMPSERASENEYVFLDPEKIDVCLKDSNKHDLKKLVHLLMRHKRFIEFKKRKENDN